VGGGNPEIDKSRALGRKGRNVRDAADWRYLKYGGGREESDSEQNTKSKTAQRVKGADFRERGSVREHMKNHERGP